MAVVVLYCVQYQNWVLQRVASCAGIVLMTAGAAWLIGALLGFIFGVPHMRENAPNGDRYRPGTSLEEISDWLTKMVIIPLQQGEHMAKCFCHESQTDNTR